MLTLNALLAGGHTDEALAFSDAVFRATAGQPDQAQIMYGIAGERRLEEYKLDWLPGYEGSRPIRVGNAAAGQFQLDVYGVVVGVGWAVGISPSKSGGSFATCWITWRARGRNPTTACGRPAVRGGTIPTRR